MVISYYNYYYYDDDDYYYYWAPWAPGAKSKFAVTQQCMKDRKLQDFRNF